MGYSGAEIILKQMFRRQCGQPCVFVSFPLSNQLQIDQTFANIICVCSMLQYIHETGYTPSYPIFCASRQQSVF